MLSAFCFLPRTFGEPWAHVQTRSGLVLELLSCSFWASLPWAWQVLQKAKQGNLLCQQEQVATLQRSCQDLPWISKSYFVFEAHAGRHTTATLRFDVRETDVDPRIVAGTLNS